MSYKIMVVDDQFRREEVYRTVLETEKFEPVYVWTRAEFDHQVEQTPVDAYIVDVVLSEGDWGDSTAASLLLDKLKDAPRNAPIFLVSEYWGDPNVLDCLKIIGEASIKVVQYLAWSEFQAAAAEGENAQRRMEALREKIVSELECWHGHSSFAPSDDASIRVLLISDPQFGDPDVDATSEFDDHLIANYLNRSKIVPDLIVIAGDIVHSGRPDQYVLAYDRLSNDLMGPLWGKNNVERMRERIVLVPGNHDVNLRFSACDGRIFKPDKQEFSADESPGGRGVKCHNEYALEPFRRFAFKMTSNRMWLESGNMTWVDRRFRHLGLQFFLLNSIEEMSADNPKLYSIKADTQRDILRSLGPDRSEAVLNIAVSHHGLPPEGMAEEKRKYSGIENWQDTQGFFVNAGIRMWLYGHNHDFAHRSYDSPPFSEKPLWMTQVPTLKIGKDTRGFCLLELKRSEGEVQGASMTNYTIKNNVISLGKSKPFELPQ